MGLCIITFYIIPTLFAYFLAYNPYILLYFKLCSLILGKVNVHERLPIYLFSKLVYHQPVKIKV